MMKAQTGPTWWSGALLLAVLILQSGCSGDGRPFEEAVEVQNLDLTELQVIPPERTIDPFFRVDQVVDFRIRGVTSAGNAVDVSTVERQWRVSDPEIATIDGNGRLVGLRASGDSIAVDLVIGGIAAAPYELTISDAPLDSIARIDGVTTLDPCLPMPYSAIGQYTDSMRPLTEVEWSFTPTASATILEEEQGVIELNGVSPGTIELTATSGGLTSEPLSITLQRTLNAISVTPTNLGLRAGSTRDMVATGSYMDGAGGVFTPPGGTPPGTDDEGDAMDAGSETVNSRVISDSVVWSVSGGGDIATISNEADTRGQLSAIAPGTVTVSASCGAVTGTGTLTISERGSTTSSSGLSFEADEIDDDTGDLFVSLTNDSNGVQVRLNDRDGDDVTSQADWRLSTSNNSNSSSTDEIIRVGNSSSDKGLIIPLGIGTQDVRVEFDGAIATLTVQVIR